MNVSRINILTRKKRNVRRNGKKVKTKKKCVKEQSPLKTKGRRKNEETLNLELIK